MAHTHTLIDAKVIQPPAWLRDNLTYECMMGSVAYGVSNNTSDLDIYGYCIPPKDMVFRIGEIPGFGKQIQRFEQFQQHQVMRGGDPKVYDFTIFSIVRYFQLAMENNPNILDSLYVPTNCVTHSNAISQYIRQNKDRFLHKGSYYKTKGYAYSQLNKCENVAKDKAVKAIRAFELEHNIPHNTFYKDINKLSLSFDLAKEYELLWQVGMYESKRFEQRKIFNYDPKFLYHVVRLVYQAEMILMEHTMELDRYKEHLKAIRRGDVGLDDVRKFFQSKEIELDKLYISSKLRHNPDEDFIRELLLNSLEHHYGTLPIERPDKYKQFYRDVSALVGNYHER